MPEPWLRGPVEGVDRVLMPAAHALLQAREDIETAATPLAPDELWLRPGGAASVGFHLHHIAGSIDRLLSYAAGRTLTSEQMEWLASERAPSLPGATAESLLREAQAAIDGAIEAIRAADARTLHEARAVGRAALPTTVFGLLFHIAEHTQRHSGALIATAKVVHRIA